MPEPLDPIQGFIFASGHPILHLCNFVTFIIFVRGDETMSETSKEDCIFKNIEMPDEDPVKANAVLISCAFYLCYMRITCFFITMLGTFIKRYKFGGVYYKQIFNLISIIIYQTTIIECWTNRRRTANFVKSEDYESDNCQTGKLSIARYWILIEITAYYVNLLVLIISLI